MGGTLGFDTPVSSAGWALMVLTCICVVCVIIPRVAYVVASIFCCPVWTAQAFREWKHLRERIAPSQPPQTLPPLEPPTQGDGRTSNEDGPGENGEMGSDHFEDEEERDQFSAPRYLSREAVVLQRD